MTSFIVMRCPPPSVSTCQGPPVQGLGAVTFGSYGVAPVPETAFREFHDIAFVHEVTLFFLIRDGVVNRGAHEALRAFA